MRLDQNKITQDQQFLRLLTALTTLPRDEIAQAGEAGG